jgi:predicted negative regulator of RcsB-dependent stress response
LPEEFMASSVASRSSRARSTVETDDVVMARALAFADWARRNAQVILTAAAIVVLGASVYMYYRYYQSHREGRAGAEFLNVAAEARAGGNEQLAARDLDNFSHKFDGTVEADQARLLLAQIKLKGNRPKEALPILQTVAGNGTPVRVQGMIMLGAAQAAAGDVKAAADTYQKAADEAKSPFERSQALRELALLNEQRGDWNGAVAAWQKLVDGSQKGAQDRAEYEMRLAEAQAHAPAAR